MRRSAAAWITRRLRKRPPVQVATTVVLKTTKWLATGQTWGWKFEVEPRDRIRGIVQSNSQYSTLDAFLFNERDYADWRNDPERWEPDVHEGIAFPIDKTAKRRETWYVVIKCLAWIDPISVSFHIVRERRED